MCYLHQMIVYNVCEIVSGEPVRLDEYLIVKLRIVYRDLAVYRIGKTCGALLRDILPYDKRHPLGKIRLHFLFT